MKQKQKQKHPDPVWDYLFFLKWVVSYQNHIL